MPKIVIFTDIDGTIMDLTDFSVDPVLDIIPEVKKRNIPIILTSAKTRAEQEKIRKELKINAPFIVENGGGIYIPKGYFNFCLNKAIENTYHIQNGKDYIVVCIGRDYTSIRTILEKIRRDAKIPFIGFGDLSVEEVSQLTGLDLENSTLAKQRDFDETIVIDKRYLPELKEQLDIFGLQCVFGGRFFHILDRGVSKGKCVDLLKDLYEKNYKRKILTIGIGDSENDLSMLEEVDIPILVEKKGGGFALINLPKLVRVKGEGPVGWREAVLNILEKYPSND
ncbi:HAD-IIB family hydrolase [Desulfothermus okinawensis]